MAVFTRIAYNNTPAQFNSMAAYFSKEPTDHPHYANKERIYLTDEFIAGLRKLGFSYQENMYISCAKVRKEGADSAFVVISVSIPWSSQFSSQRVAGFAELDEFNLFFSGGRQL